MLSSLLAHPSGTLILLTALSYGLIRMPKRAWERRDLDVISGYCYFHIKEYQENLNEKYYNLESQYGVRTAY